MSETFNIYEAKTQFSKLVNRAAAGEDIIIARAGKPLVRLTTLDDDRPARKPGLLAGRFTISMDFDDPLPRSLHNILSGLNL